MLRRVSPLLPLLALLGCHTEVPPSSTDVPAPAPSALASAASGPSDAGAWPPPEPTLAELCLLPVTSTAAITAAHTFHPIEPHCRTGANTDPFCDSVDDSPDPKNACFVANTNIARAERESRRVSSKPPRASSPWDGVAKPQYLDLVDAHLHLTPAEQGKLHDNGFVVLDRYAYANYANAFHDIFQQELPLYVGLDPILHAVFRAGETSLQAIETKRLQPALRTMLSKLRSGLRNARGSMKAETAHDLDVYLGVAQALAVPGKSDDEEDPDRPKRKRAPRTLFGNDKEVDALLELVASHTMTDPANGIELFGRARVIDFSQMEPRGHYADYDPMIGKAPLGDYFQAMMWLSRLELNLVSRSCRSSQPGATPDPSETPREAVDALAIAELAQSTHAMTEITEFDEVYRSFAGKREDVSVADLLQLEQSGQFHARDADAANDLKAAIGTNFQRTARIHFMPEGSTTLPAIMTLFGPRIVPDTGPLTRLVHDGVPNRAMLGFADVAYVLGSQRARNYLSSDLTTYPTLQSALDAARAELVKNATGDDVYTRWLRSIEAVAAPATPNAIAPSFFAKPAYQDFRLDSALVAYGQMRHAFVLVAAQGYDSYGCEIPEGYVDPSLPVWDALVDHVHNLHALTKSFEGLDRVIGMLRDIARTEATGAPISEPEERWLGMVSEHIPKGGYSDSGEPPKWTGWYFDMFDDREIGATRSASFVADYFTLTNAGKVRYLGADGPRLGVFIVDVGGVPRAMVGPVAKGYETTSDLNARYNDKSVDGQTEEGEPAPGPAPPLAVKSADWRASYAAPPSPDPALGLQARFFFCDGDGKSDPATARLRVAMRAKKLTGKVSLELLDHHGEASGPAVTLDVGPRWTIGEYDMPAAAYAQEKSDPPPDGPPMMPRPRLLPSSGPGPGAGPGAPRAPEPVAEPLQPVATGDLRSVAQAVHLHLWDLGVSGMGRGAFDWATSASVFNSKEGEVTPGPRGLVAIDIGVETPPVPPRKHSEW